MNDKTHYIYGLIDPETNVIRYVGCSVNPLKRYREHVQTRCICNQAKWEWAKSLEARGLDAGLIMLDKCNDRATGRERESAWIKTLMDDGVSLTNAIYMGYTHPCKGRRWRNRR